MQLVDLDKEAMLTAKSEPTTEAEKLNPLKDPARWVNSLTEYDYREREANLLERQLLLGSLACWDRMKSATVERCWVAGNRLNREFPEEINYL